MDNKNKYLKSELNNKFFDYIELIDDLKGIFIERDEEIETIACGYITGTNVLLIGEPGTGKSLIIKKFANLLGMDFGNGYFHYLLTKYTEPSEIIGPLDINKLKEGKYEVITNNKLPEANLIFLDEIFNANSAILNSLLTLINEKKLILGNIYKDIEDLIVVYGASNHMPSDNLLKAFLDRFPIRLLVKSISPDVDNYKKLLNKEIKIESSDETQAKFNREESIEFAKNMNKFIINRVEELIDFRFIRSFFSKLKLLKLDGGIFISDRSIKSLIKMIIAHSMIKSERLNAEPTFEDIRFVLSKIWTDEEQKYEIERILV
ncbi:AAA family ATPase [Marinitoga sp. 1155]|uniref:AAA family ATPase n=1 Tax=Marinitoga sp. 1155 TaxID=1428448 RepID=UPI0006410BC9|nr:AAA family ATPase [Marinitoga sp. 1155]KLO23489.1 ATPase [Marinitoga sp. 1155]